VVAVCASHVHRSNLYSLKGGPGLIYFLYRCTQRLGKGSFGYASLILRDDTKEYFVAKLIRYKHISVKEKEHVLREIKTMAHISNEGGHPYLVRFRESFVVSTSGQLCIVMDYCDSGDMAGLISAQRKKKAPFSEPQIHLWLLQMLSAADFLHSHKVIHRDIKPANVFMHGAVCKLGDLGLSKQVGVAATKAAKHTQCGSPLYLAPEVHFGQNYGKFVDIWALGCTLFEVMMLSHAFIGSDTQEVLTNIAWAQHAPIGDSWTPELVTVLKGMLALKAENRPDALDIIGNSIFRNIISSGHLHPKALRHRYASKSSPTSVFADADTMVVEVHVDLNNYAPSLK